MSVSVSASARPPLLLAALLGATLVVAAAPGCSRPTPPAPQVFEASAPAPASGHAASASTAPDRGPGAPVVAHSPPASEATAVIEVEGIVCQGCANAAAKAARDVAGVTYARSLFEEGTVVVRYRPELTDADTIALAIAQTDRGAAPPFRAKVISDGEGTDAAHP